MRRASLVLALLALPACGPDSSPLVESPDAPSQFTRFRLERATGPCPSLFPCSSAFEIRADGRFEQTRGDMVVLTQMSPADLAAAVRVVMDPEFVRLLEAPPPCAVILTDGFEQMELEAGGRLRTDAGARCRREPAVQAVRAEMERLRAAYGF